MLKVGDSWPDFTYGLLTRTDIVRYAGASYDLNPMHYDDEIAQSVGYPSVFAHGMFSAGLLGSCLSRWLGPECVRRYTVRFCAIVWPGDVLSAKSRVIRVYEHANEQRADIELTMIRQTGEVAVTGAATVSIQNHSGLGT